VFILQLLAASNALIFSGSHFAGFDEGEGATEDAGAAEGAGAALLPKLNQLLIYISYPQNFFCTIANFKRRPSLREVWRL